MVVTVIIVSAALESLLPLIFLDEVVLTPPAEKLVDLDLPISVLVDLKDCFLQLRVAEFNPKTEREPPKLLGGQILLVGHINVVKVPPYTDEPFLDRSLFHRLSHGLESIFEFSGGSAVCVRD